MIKLLLDSMTFLDIDMFHEESRFELIKSLCVLI